MPRPGITYEIDEAWREKVLSKIEGFGGQAELARVLGVERSVISELLKGKIKNGKRTFTKRSPMVPEINRVVGLPQPRSLTFTEDEIDLIQIYRALSDADRAQVRSDAVRRLPQATPEAGRANEVSHTLRQAVAMVSKDAAGQTQRVASEDEGSPRSRRTRRAPRSS